MELVHNAIAHSRASWLELYIAVGASEVEVRVTDDGNGTKEPPERGVSGAAAAPMADVGLGLNNVEARARELHGTFMFTPTADRGSVARWQVPLPRPATAGDD